jgi:uncharacterized sodium:solute symporter family permease YidK
MEKRFRALRIIGMVYKVFAFIVLALGILFGFIYLIFGLIGGASAMQRDASFGAIGGVVGVIGGLAILIYAVIVFLILYGAGEAVFLALAVEENTRETNMLLRSLTSRPQPFPT